MEQPEMRPVSIYKISNLRSPLLFFGGGLVAKLCPTLCDPMDCSPPGSSVSGFSRQEYWSGLLCPPSRTSSWPRDQRSFSITAISLLRCCSKLPTHSYPRAQGFIPAHSLKVRGLHQKGNDRKEGNGQWDWRRVWFLLLSASGRVQTCPHHHWPPVTTTGLLGGAGNKDGSRNTATLGLGAYKLVHTEGSTFQQEVKLHHRQT